MDQFSSVRKLRGELFNGRIRLFRSRVTRDDGSRGGTTSPNMLSM
jgi:hypothetical protein